MSFKSKIKRSVNEKDVENTYRNELLKIEGSYITSPYSVDGLLEAKNVRTLLEFKYKEQMKNKLVQCNVLIQCLFYLKKFETSGEKLPTTIFVGDINECFAIHTNSIVKYLSSEIDWKVAPSQAHRENPKLIKAMVGDTNILPFVFDVNENFSIKTAIDKISDFTNNVVRKIRVTGHNISTIFDYFDKNILGNVKLSTNEKANLFIQVIINPSENYTHPQKKNTLVTKSFGSLKINSNLFKSFFKHFEGDVYSPKEKEELTSLVDRLIEDVTRRNKGEFFTPTPFVDLAHKYISDTFGEDWKEEYIVWDNSSGTSNLTRDYNFKELYCSTLEQSDIDTSNQMGYNRNATKFQFDFLNDTDSELPKSLQKALSSGKKILFLINPPYARSAANGKNNKVQKGVADTVVGDKMRLEKWGACSANIYAQFLYRIYKYQKVNKNIHIGIFCKPNYLTSPSYKKFRKKFFSEFGFEKGFLFQASHFSDVATQWGINFAVFSNKINKIKEEFNHELVDLLDLSLDVVGTKKLYNLDKSKKLSDWIKNKTKPVEFPKMSSYLNVRDGVKYGSELPEDCFSTVVANSNSVYENQTSCYILNAGITRNVGKKFVNNSNLLECTTLFTARKTIKGNWINDKDEYLAPNEEHPLYEQFTIDSLVYSLFNNSSQQSSLRQVDYKEKKWDIKNEFFWLSRNEMMELANNSSFDNMYNDARNSEERYMYTKLFKEGYYEKLSPDAKAILDMATELLRKSLDMRQVLSDNHPEYHLDAWDAGYAQLKLVWGEYFKEEFKEFRDAYNEFSERLVPLVYELGFLKE